MVGVTRLTWLGHSTVLLESAGSVILTDPVLRGRIGPIRRASAIAPVDLGAVDTVLISHLHQDHLDLPSLRLLRPDLRLIVPFGSADRLRAEGYTDVSELKVGDSVQAGAATIRAVRAVHDGRRRPFGPARPALGYRIDAEHATYFAGDTDLYPEMALLAGGLDLALLPVGGWGPTLRGGHMDPLKAARALALLQPQLAVAIHWGTFWPIGMGRIRRSRFELPARQFGDEAARLAPLVRIGVLDPGGWLDLPSAMVRPP
jgi:L-ascorbate metabolism protein UlaG (beta-lactamase superfamily)